MGVGVSGRDSNFGETDCRVLLGQFPTFGPHLAPNCHMWLKVVVNMWPRPHPGQRFRRTGQTRWGYSHRSFKPMVKSGLSTLACEDWNRRRAWKKPAVASSTDSKAATSSHCGERRAHWDTQGQCGHPLHPDLPSRLDLSCHWIRLARTREWADDLRNSPSL